MTGMAHYVGHNKVTRIPPTFIYLDSEASMERRGIEQVQTFGLASVILDRRSHRGQSWLERSFADFDTPTTLWKWVGDRCKAKTRTVLVAHNLAYDLRICDAFRILPDQGWELKALALGGRSTWCSWRRDGATLQMVDSMTWLPMALERIGKMVGVTKPDLPSWEDSRDAWRERCRADVLILADAFRTLLDWIKADDLGNFKPTGAGQSWAAYRHRFMEHKLLAHVDDRAREAERTSAFSGRCEAWRHGQMRGGPFVEWDYTTAYANIGAKVSVPVVLLGSHDRMSAHQWEVMTGKANVLTEVEVETDVPTLPARHDGRIVWPVGRFVTTVWDNELALAVEHGAKFKIRRAWTYRSRPALEAFSTWALELMDGQGAGANEVVRTAVKHWSRSLIGKFGSRYSTWEEYGSMPTSDVRFGKGGGDDVEDRWEWLQIGHQLRRSTGVQDSSDGVVAIMAYVMAQCRVNLWAAMMAAGIENVLYVDTDSVVVTPVGSDRLAEAALTGLRRKRTYDSVRVLAPRQIVVDGELRASGVPRGSIKVAESTWEGEVWSELSTSIGTGHPDSVTITPRRMTLAGTDRRRVHLARGETAPVVLTLESQWLGSGVVSYDD